MTRYTTSRAKPLRRSVTGFATPLLTFCMPTYLNVSDGVANPVRLGGFYQLLLSCCFSHYSELTHAPTVGGDGGRAAMAGHAADRGS